MNAVQNRASENRKSWSEKIKAYLGASNRRPATKSTFKPRLESLEGRDVPSTMGVGATSQFQADMNYLNQVFQQQAATIGKDMNVLVQDMQHGQTGLLGADLVQLQADISNVGPALTAAIDAIQSGHVPSPTTPSNVAPTPPTTTSNVVPTPPMTIPNFSPTPHPVTSSPSQTPPTTTLSPSQTPSTTTSNNSGQGSVVSTPPTTTNSPPTQTNTGNTGTSSPVLGGDIAKTAIDYLIIEPTAYKTPYTQLIEQDLYNLVKAYVQNQPLGGIGKDIQSLLHDMVSEANFNPFANSLSNNSTMLTDLIRLAVDYHNLSDPAQPVSYSEFGQSGSGGTNYNSSAGYNSSSGGQTNQTALSSLVPSWWRDFANSHPPTYFGLPTTGYNSSTAQDNLGNFLSGQEFNGSADQLP